MDKEGLINKYLPSDLASYLKNGRYMSIGHIIYKATVKLSSMRNDNNTKRDYYVDFIEVPKEFVKDVTGQSDFVKDIYQHYNYDYEYPIPCNMKSQYDFVIDGLIWNSYMCPVQVGKPVKNDLDLEKKCPTTLKLFRHIYGDSLMMAIDYMTVEFMNPVQPLPVQVLFSRENNTGKTTVLSHRRLIYGRNATIIDSGTFDEKFNAPVVGKNFVGIDEGKLKEEASVEKLKAMVTNPTVQFRAMRKSAVEVPNFGKWAIATNKFNWAKLDKEDSRFWVIKVPVIEDQYDPTFERKLEAEIPHWIGFLEQRWKIREDRSQPESLMKMRFWKKLSRLWLLEKEYSTSALEDTKRASRSLDAKSFLDEIIEWFEKRNQSLGEPDKIRQMYTIPKLLRDNLHMLHQRITTPVIKNILEHDLSIKPEMNKAQTGLANFRFTNFFDDHRSKIQRTGVYLLNYDDLVFMRDGIKVSEAETIEEDEDSMKKSPVQKEIQHKK